MGSNLFPKILDGKDAEFATITGLGSNPFTRIHDGSMKAVFKLCSNSVTMGKVLGSNIALDRYFVFYFITEFCISYIKCVVKCLDTGLNFIFCFRSNNQDSPLKFTYTAMHGVGYQFIEAAFQACNFKPCIPVKEQVCMAECIVNCLDECLGLW